MKKRGRRVRLADSSRQKTKSQTAVTTVDDEAVVKKPCGNRGRPRKTTTSTTGSLLHSNGPASKKNTAVDEPVQPRPENRPKPSGRPPAALCRLCHGKFSPRSLRHAFRKSPRDSAETAEDTMVSDTMAQPPLFFHTDFQRLVGVPLDRDPRLSEFVCKKCHANFYKCHGILIRFLQRVNLPPAGDDNTTAGWKNIKFPQLMVNSTTPSSFTSDHKCLHSLVSWAHHHAEACHSCPNLKEVLEGHCWGSIRAVWGCVDGHSYAMDTQSAAAAQFQPGSNHHGHTAGSFSSGSLLGSADEFKPLCVDEEEVENEERPPRRQDFRADHLALQPSPAAATPQTLTDGTATCTDEFLWSEQAPSPAPAHLEDRTGDSDLSDRDMSIVEEFEDGRKRGSSDDELFQPYPKKPRRTTTPNKRRQSPKGPQEPKIKKKPGPKPGWKNKFKPKGEELPNIYKCPYQGCSAVYRAPDGLKKHIKEHHEEVRERPCPHPGCNKVFMIDRYLQRHVKLIHTDQRNYICDQCGQTFKQRKHLSVHQMRHSGAKPLQCEVCGFQCRQRASLKYHMTKHKAEADLEFACLLCKKRFEKAHNLNVHMSMVHPLTQGDSQRAGSQTQHQQYADIQTITVTGEVIQQDRCCDAKSQEHHNSELIAGLLS